MIEAIKRNILNHQMKGVRLHGEIAVRYTLLGMNKWAKCHKKQCIEETCNFLHTNCMIAEEGNELIALESVPAIALPSANTNMSESEKDNVHRALVKSWKEWELETLEMYRQMKDREPKQKWWSKLYRCVEKELEKIKKIK